jgi:aryl-alcohol dehydrogenase-like predicted oxidoreductase
MDLRALAGTGILVSPLGLGTVKFGRNQGVKYPRPFDLPTDTEIHRLLDVAREGGVNYLDTAPAYGTSEERIGHILGERPEPWIVGTKAGETFADGESRHDFAPEAIRTSLERSLRRLRRDRLDIVLLHSDGNDAAILRESGAVDVLREFRERGLAGAVGISTKTVEGGLLAFEFGLDVVMATYNPWQRDEEPVLDAAVRAGRSVLVKKALGSGWMGRAAPESGTDVDPVRQAFRFIFSHPGATSVVVGTVNPENLRKNCEIAARAVGTAEKFS